MDVLCQCYVNQVRFSLVMQKMLLNTTAIVCPLSGTYVTTRRGTRCEVECLGYPCEFLIYDRDKKCHILLTGKQSGDLNGKVIDYKTDAFENIYLQVLRLCLNKAFRRNTDASPIGGFKIECVLDGCTATISYDGDMTCKLNSPKGECFLESVSIPEVIHRECRGIKSFTCSLITNSSEKEITVKKGELEIFREIAHYLNRALVFVTLDGDVVKREYCITPTGCCERIVRNGVPKIIKVPFTKMSIDKASVVGAIDLSLDVLLRSQYFTQALGGV